MRTDATRRVLHLSYRVTDRCHVGLHVGLDGEDGRGPGWLMGVALFLLRHGQWLVQMVGWGWDDETPIRPWPTLRSSTTAAGHRVTTLACCGFFAAFYKSRRAAGEEDPR